MSSSGSNRKPWATSLADVCHWQRRHVSFGPLGWWHAAIHTVLDPRACVYELWRQNKSTMQEMLLLYLDKVLMTKDRSWEILMILNTCMSCQRTVCSAHPFLWEGSAFSSASTTRTTSCKSSRTATLNLELQGGKLALFACRSAVIDLLCCAVVVESHCSFLQVFPSSLCCYCRCCCCCYTAGLCIDEFEVKVVKWLTMIDSRRWWRYQNTTVRIRIRTVYCTYCTRNRSPPERLYVCITYA